jgi:hypothetical protein
LEIPDPCQLALLLWTFAEEKQHIRAEQNHSPHGLIAEESEERSGIPDVHQGHALNDLKTTH